MIIDNLFLDFNHMRPDRSNHGKPIRIYLLPIYTIDTFFLLINIKIQELCSIHLYDDKYFRNSTFN